LTLVVVLYEKGIVSKIGAGENGGRQITYDYTVRKLIGVADLVWRRSSSVQKEISMAADRSWSLNHIGVAAFIQNPVSLAIGAPRPNILLGRIETNMLQNRRNPTRSLASNYQVDIGIHACSSYQLLGLGA
jgi:Protein of unknown function (DUF1223)